MKRSSYLNGPMIRCGATILVLMVLHTMAHPLSEEFYAASFAVSGSASSLFDHQSRTKRSKDIDDHLLMFLMKFGYLPQSDLETGNLRTEEQVRDAIKTMQAFAHIPVTGVVDKETQELMRKPRCGLPDIISDSYRAKRSTTMDEEPIEGHHRRRHSASRAIRKKRYTVQGQRWHQTNLTWSLRKGPSSSKDIDDGQVRQQVERALKLWQGASKLNFNEINSDSADIRIFFHKGYHSDGYPFDGKGTLLAHAFFPGGGIGGDAHFDEDEPWVPDNSNPGSELSFFAVAVHEFGHSLGLSHSSVQGAIMYPYYQSMSGGEYALSSDDITGIQAIYGSRNEGGRVTNPALRPTTSTTTSRPRPKPELPTKPTEPTKKPLYPTKYPTGGGSSPHPDSPVKPNTCDTSYDAISIIRRELFIFKDRYFWRIGPKGLDPSYPAEINVFWHGLPANLTHIDAIYEKNGKMVIFIGRQYWTYNDNKDGNGPYPLTQLGLPEDLDKLDGALVWGHNGKTYFFSGSMYWRFDEEAGKVELDYPRDMSMWKGVPYNIDAVFQHDNGKTYFFKGKGFWEFNDRKMKVTSPTPSLSAPYWMSCPTGMQTALHNHHHHQVVRPVEGHYRVNSAPLVLDKVMHMATIVATVLLAFCVSFLPT